MGQSAQSNDDQDIRAYDWTGMLGGIRAAFSLPGLVMACSFMGFGALINDVGFPLLAGVAMMVRMPAMHPLLELGGYFLLLRRPLPAPDVSCVNGRPPPHVPRRS